MKPQKKVKEKIQFHKVVSALASQKNSVKKSAHKKEEISTNKSTLLITKITSLSIIV